MHFLVFIHIFLCHDGVEYAAKKERRTSISCIQPPCFILYFPHILILSSRVVVLRIMVILEFCHHCIDHCYTVWGWGREGFATWDMGYWIYPALRYDVMHMDWTMMDVLLDVYKFLCPELNFKVAWFWIYRWLMILIGFGASVWFSCILSYVLCNPMPWGRRKNTVTPELLWTKGNIIVIILFIYFIYLHKLEWP